MRYKSSYICIFLGSTFKQLSRVINCAYQQMMSHSVRSRIGRLSWDDLIRMSSTLQTAPSCTALSRASAATIQGNDLGSLRNYRAKFKSNHCSHGSSRRFSTKSTETVAQMDSQTVYQLLKLSKFNKAEIDWRFDQIIQAAGGGTKCRKSEVETDNLQQPFVMHQSDLESYLFQRYLRMEDQWNSKYHNTHVNEDIIDDKLDPSRVIQLQLKRAMEVHQQQQIRIVNIRECAERDAASIFQLLLSTATSLSSIDSTANTTTLTKQEFFTSIHNLATQIHYQTILPLAASMLLVGASVGVISPIMPFLAAKLDLTNSQYGTVVSSFALSKMLGNVPSAILVERHGRKPYLVHSLWFVGLGVAGLGLSNNWIELSACRMTIGLGVAALTTASTLTVADVSTPLSRASTYAPVMSAFAAGTALGPALGGILCDEFGLRDTFLMVAVSYGIVGLWNNVSLRETGRHGLLSEDCEDHLPWHEDVPMEYYTRTKGNASMATTVTLALKDTIHQWSSLLNDRNVRPIVIMNGFYMMAISGSQMTILPLLLTSGGPSTASTGMALTATAMGYVYMWMSAVQVLGNPAAGRFADKAGKHNAIVAGGLLTSVSMATVPVACAYGLMAGDYVTLDVNDVNWPVLAATLGVWSLGGTLLATSHVAAISDTVSDSRRSQAIALLRTAGDVGFLCGALGAGFAADLMGDVGVAMQGGSAVLMAATGWFGAKTFALNRRGRSEKR